MDIKASLPKLVVATVLIGGAIVVVGKLNGHNGHSGAGSTITVNVPTLSTEAKQGAKLFAENCMVCHGKNGGGSKQGPPLIHKIYESGHHGDQSFVLAAKLGVRAHHWKFGNMPQQPQVTDRDVLRIVGYIREVQRANGIH